MHFMSGLRMDDFGGVGILVYECLCHIAMIHYLVKQTITHDVAYRRPYMCEAMLLCFATLLISFKFLGRCR